MKMRVIFYYLITAVINFDNGHFVNMAISAETSISAPDSTFTHLSVVNPFDAKNNLYQQIFDEMNLEYEHIGKREAARILDNRSTSITGGLNSIGLSYKRPFIDFSISADRTLAPDLYDDKRWIVTDKFSIYIDASHVLGNLKNLNIIDISEQNLGAFAGIVFKRTYTSTHFANSYSEGLSTHFEKLFMPFTFLHIDKIKKMQSNEIIFKEDSISVKAGGMVSIPLYTGVTGKAGVMAKFEKLSRVEVVSSYNDQGLPNNVLISYEKSKLVMAGVSIGIQADFLKILKMTLLSYDFSYELTSSYKIYLNFNQDFLFHLAPENPILGEVSQILKNREGDLNILAPFIISEEKKISKSLSNKYNVLLLGGSKKSKTEQIQVTTNGREKVFFRHYYEKIKYTEDLLSRLFSSVVFALNHTEPSASKVTSDSKKVSIEYNSERNLLENHESLNIDGNEQNLSMIFSAEFTTKKSNGNAGRKYREQAVYTLERYSGIDPLAVGMVQDEYLVAPFSITGQYVISIDGVRYLNSLSTGEVFDHLNGLCNEYQKTGLINFRNFFDHCRLSLQNDYIDYLKDLSHDKITEEAIDVCLSQSKKNIFSSRKKRAYLKNCLAEVSYKDKENWTEIPLWQLKNLSNNIVNNSNSKIHYYNLFGIQNVFFHGQFDAKTKDGRDFSTSFHEGIFKGLGTVDHFMRMENLRAPASVVID